jgi:hypothetical protein
MRFMLAVALAALAVLAGAEDIEYYGGSGGGGSFNGGDVANPIGLPSGSTSSPALYFTANGDMGLWRGGETLNIQNKTGTAEQGKIELGQRIVTIRAQDISPSGHTGEITCYDAGDIECYVYIDDGAGTASFTQFQNAQVKLDVPIQGPNGSTSAPTYSFTGDPDTGLRIFNPGYPEIVTNGSTLARFDWSSGLFINKTGSQTLPVYGFLADTDNGLFRPATNTVGITTGGSEAARFVNNPNGLQLAAVTFSNLGSPSDGTIVFCSDCTKATPCAGSGNGALAKRLNGAWDCD